MIVLPLATFLIFIIICFFLERNGIQRYVPTLANVAVFSTLVFFLASVGHYSLAGISAYQIPWLEFLNIQVDIGMALTESRLLMLVTSLVSFLFFVLFGNLKKDGDKTYSRSLLSALFLLMAILSTDIIIFLLSWVMIGIIDCKMEKKIYGSSLIYTGIDNLLMFFGMLLLSVAVGATDFHAINEGFREASGDKLVIGYMAFSIIFLSVIMRACLFPFIANAQRYLQANSLYFHTSQVLTVVPLGFVVIYRIRHMAFAPILMEGIFVLSSLTILFALLLALRRKRLQEIILLSTIAAMGVVYATAIQGLNETALIFLIAIQLLRVSINIFLLKIQEIEGGKKSTNRVYFWLLLIALGSYAGIPGLTNFFLFFDIVWGILALQSFPILKSIPILAFVILNGVLCLKILVSVFDVKKMFFETRSKEKLDGGILAIFLPAAVSLGLLFYSIPLNLMSKNAQMLKNILSDEFGGGIQENLGSIQFQNIAMILLFLFVLISLFWGGYIYIIKDTGKAFYKMETRMKALYGIMESGFLVEKLPSKFIFIETIRSGSIMDRLYLNKAVEYLLHLLSKVGSALSGRRPYPADILLMQVFGIMAIVLIYIFKEF